MSTRWRSIADRVVVNAKEQNCSWLLPDVPALTADPAAIAETIPITVTAHADAVRPVVILSQS
jgi:hypothetical protein